MDLKEPLLADLKKPELDVEVFKFKIPLKYKESELDGLDWGSGYVARRMKYIQNLGDYAFNATPDHSKPRFILMMNRGGLTVPLKDWRRDYRLE